MTHRMTSSGLTLILSVAGLALACATAGDTGGPGNGSGASNGTSVGGSSSGSSEGGADSGSSQANGSSTGSSEGSGADSSSGDAGSANDANTDPGSAGGDGEEGTVGTAGNDSGQDGSGGGSTDDPPTTGGSGTTDDPPTTGGSGTTDDPPSGGDGTTEDPGLGGTNDPGMGGTGDPGIGGTGDPGTGGSTGDPPDECVPTELANVNVIVFGDASPSGADSEGRMYIGGNATFTGGYSVGTAEAADPDRYDLVVGGTLTGTPVVKNGKVYVNDPAFAGSVDTPYGVYTPPQTPSPVDFAALETELVGISLALAQYPANGSVVDTTGTLRFTGDTCVGVEDCVYVFYVTTTQLETASEISIETQPPDATVIVNVSGETLTWQGKGFKLQDGGASCKGGTSVSCSQIVWNMPEVTSLTLGGIGVQGSIFAPFATFTGDGGNVDGQVIVRELRGGIEFHPYFFTGCLMLPE